tara:strand:+ start:757 stop:1152 length:396 start_codon:yes stop_codon:yes gene_type:complete
MKQLEIINKLNQLDVFGQLTETTNIYEHYDCYNDNYLIEIKSRQREYNPWLIEKYKYDKNYTQATKEKKLFIYVTEYKTRIITWNITDLTNSGYNFNWQIKQQPETTEFYLQEPIPKRVGYLLEQFGKILR